MARVREIAVKIRETGKKENTEGNKKKIGEERSDEQSLPPFFVFLFCCERESSNLFDAEPGLSRRTRYKRPGRNSKTEPRLLYSRLVEHQEFSASYGTNACDTCHARLNFKPPPRGKPTVLFSRYILTSSLSLSLSLSLFVDDSPLSSSSSLASCSLNSRQTSREFVIERLRRRKLLAMAERMV